MSFSESNNGQESESSANGFEVPQVHTKISSSSTRKIQSSAILLRTSSGSQSSGDEKKLMSASEWTSCDLEKLNVACAESPLSIREILDKLKENSRKKAIPVPDSDVIAAFEAIFRQKLDFSVDLGLFEDHVKTLRKGALTVDKQWRIDDAYNEFCLAMKEIVQWFRSIAQCNLGDVYQNLNASELHESLESTNQESLKWLLDIWRVRVFDFVTEVKRILDLYNTYETPIDERRIPLTTSLREAFSLLFLNFTQASIFSHQNKFAFFCRTSLKTRKLKVRQKTVGSVPAIRYFTQDAEGRHKEELITVIQVNYAAIKKWSPNKEGLLQRFHKDILGRIGLELISQRKLSFFGPVVLEIVCIRTEIILVLLEMSLEHYDDISDRGKRDDKHRSMIHYSDVFDIMKESDRNQLNKIFFWLGLQQHNNDYRLLDNFGI